MRHASVGGKAWGFRGGLHLGDVLLADHMLSWLDFLGGSGDKDATALTAAIWLADISAGFPLTTVGLEVPIATCRERPVKGFLCILSVLDPHGHLFLLSISRLFLEHLDLGPLLLW